MSEGEGELEMRKFRVIVVVLAMVGLTTAGTMFALGHNAKRVRSTKTEATAQSGAPREGIKVHGHWTIDVRNPDGSLASHTDFENALVAGSGDKALSWLLARSNSTGHWRIAVSGDAGPMCVEPYGPENCEIYEPNVTGSNSNLTVSSPATGDNANKLVLNGHFTAGVNGSFTRVDTYLTLCSATYAPGAGCDEPGQTRDYGSITVPFTHKTLDPGVAVAPGQQVQVTVVISFS